MAERKTIDQGESVAEIAANDGLHPDTVWMDDENAELRAKRNSLYVLNPGDVLFVPDKRVAKRACSTSIRHRFRRNAVPDVLHLQLLYEGKARAGLSYELIIEGTSVSGMTNDEGRLRQPVPPNAKSAVLKISNTESYVLSLHHLDPEETENGMRQRLFNLGFIPDPAVDEPVFDEACRTFLRHHDMKASQAKAAPFSEKLRGVHGS